MSQPQVGAQLIIYGERAQTDLPGVAAEVADAGYAGVEAGAPSTPKQVERIRAALAGTALAFTGGHSSLDQLKDLAVVETLANSVSALGGRFLLVSGRCETLEGYRDGARILNQAGGRSREAGLTLCYHNHFWEFNEIAGTRPIDLLTGETDPELVKLCPDTYWVQVGGEKPEEFISRHQNRCPYFHFKDGLGGEKLREFRELGRGCVDQAAALKAALACSPEWIVTEQDHTEGDPAESIRISRDCLKSLGL